MVFSKVLLKRVSYMLFALLAIGGCGSKDKTIVLKLGHGLDVTHPVHKAMEHMARLVFEDSKGRVRIDIYPSEQLGSEREIIEQLQLGSVAMTKTSSSPLESFIPSMSVFSVPYLFRDEEHAWKVFLGDIGKGILRKGEEKGLKGLCYYDAGFRSFYMRDNPVNTPEDLKGKKIRVQKSKTSMATIEALGASPTPIDWGELYTSLAQGMVDGAENNPPSFETSKHYETCKYYSLDEHAGPPDVLLISTKWWNKLSDDIKTILQNAADSSSVYQRKLWKEKTAHSLSAVEAAGVTINRPDKKPFREKVMPMYKQYDGTETGALIDQIQSLK
ncbi:MAG: TRAP transporter substrate-binding protein [Chitinispirillaceae bacterium]|nr:TRAP transporter substrate-binding protein [Chitinispirillaceae bacterium]